MWKKLMDCTYKREVRLCFGKYDVGDTIGRGRFSKVYHAKNTEKVSGDPGEHVALKAINRENLSDEDLYTIEKEICIMKSLSHPNIVQLYDVIVAGPKVYLAMEYVSGGELAKEIRQKGKLDGDLARKYFQQLISAVHYCHVRGVAHRDIRPENILLDADGNVKVADFGMCATSAHRAADGMLKTRCGTEGYTAPEVLASKGGYDGAAADVYSCGVVLYNMLTGNFPIDPSNQPRYLRRSLSGDFDIPQWFDDEVSRLMRRLLEADPKKRITILRLTEVPWFRKGLEGVKEMAAATKKVLEGSVGTAVKGRKVLERSMAAVEVPKVLEGSMVAEEVLFTTTLSAGQTLARLEEIGRGEEYSVAKTESEVKMENVDEVGKVKLRIVVKIVELKPWLRMVEVNITGEDDEEYTRFCRQKLGCGLRDIVWVLHDNVK